MSPFTDWSSAWVTGELPVRQRTVAGYREWVDMERRIGAVIREARRRAGLSQEALAEQTGLSVKSLSSLETGRTRPSVATLERLAKALNLSPAPAVRVSPMMLRQPRPPARRWKGRSGFMQLGPTTRDFAPRQSCLRSPPRGVR